MAHGQVTPDKDGLAAQRRAIRTLKVGPRVPGYHISPVFSPALTSFVAGIAAEK